MDKKIFPVVRFQNQEFLICGSLEQGGPIATREQYANGSPSFAHLFANGVIMRLQEVIGSRKDLEIIGEEEEPEVSDDGVMLKLLIGDGWPNQGPFLF